MKATTPSRLLQRTRALLFAFAIFGVPAASIAGGGVFVSVAIAPPPIPFYVQPIAPAPGYIWTPGYWAYGPDGYYWVPGEWVLAPYVGALWTPGYWGWSDGLYVWNSGYWGMRVGFYGGINYGFGYTGHGYYGGYWRGNAFYYNRAANNVNPAVVHNTYNTTITNVTASRASYNGGTGGTLARPDAAQRAYMSQPHTTATAVQLQHQQVAANQRAQLASVNQGRPAIAATPTARAYGHPGVIPATTVPARNAVANAGVHTQAVQPASQGRAAPAHVPQQAQPKVYAQQSQRQAYPQGGPPARPGNTPQVHAQAAPQRYVQVAPQGHPQSGPQGHPQAMQGHSLGGPPAQHENVPQGHAQAAPQRYPQVAPQGHPQSGPQGHQQVAMQGAPQGHPQGGRNSSGDGGDEGHHGR
jgi:hypothetical protein